MRHRTIQVDTETLALARKQDPAAREALYRAVGPYVFTLARRMLASTSLAEDVLHETFIEVFTKIGGLRGDAEFVAWVRRIAINKCLMHVRSGWVSRQVDLNVTELVPAVPGPEIGPDQWALQTALDELSDVARAVVWLYDVEGYTHQEIGRMMGRTASFSKSQLARAHRKLRLLLTEAAYERDLQQCHKISKS